MTEPRDSLLDELHAGRQRFLALVADLRPELHRYCARMVGSLADGEDIVQESLARAYFALPEMSEVPPLRPWLFRIVHRQALDHLRRYDRRMGQPLAVVEDTAADAGLDPEDTLAHEQAMGAALSRFGELAPAQRSCVILKDVLGHSLDEIAALLDLSVPAVKAALHRGRERLRATRDDEATEARETSPVVARYAQLFNARDWDGVRALLAEDVQLDLPMRSQRSGRRAVGVYFTNYDRVADWLLVPTWLDGREVIAVYRDARDARPGYFVVLTVSDGQIAHIHDFRYVPYVAAEARWSPALCLVAPHDPALEG